MAAASATRAVSKREIFLILLATIFMAAALGSFFYIQNAAQRNQAWLGLADDVEVTINSLERIARETAQGIEPDLRVLADIPFEMEDWFLFLREGDEVTGAPPLPANLLPDVDNLEAVWERTLPSVELILDNQVPYRRSTSNVVTVTTTVATVSEQLRSLADRLSQRGDTPSAFLAASQLARVEALRDHARNLIGVGTNPATESAAMAALVEEISEGQAALLAGGLDTESARLANELSTAFQPAINAVGQIVRDTDALLSFQEAGTGLLANVTPVTTAFATLDQGVLELSRQVTQGPELSYALGGLAVLFLVLFILFFLLNARRQVRIAQERDSAQQQAILGLLDEITNLADGDLTVDVTVTEDFTGAIADSINYTVASMRGLVGTITSTSVEIAGSAGETQNTAQKMASDSERQTQEITEASDAMTQMSSSMQEVARRAEEIAGQAQQSVEVAHNGAETVGRTIQGMTALRDQIQDTSKRIKRLGESSQEIGNIIEFINDISEQTNTLALNASIQAAMAGEAGRGFAVVADEVQRLAERASNATRQIETLVKTIQADTTEAIISMERSTANVVSGAKSAEEAGQALQQIETSSNALAGLIQEISTAARDQSESAGKIAGTMQLVREIAVQTSGSATQTSQAVGELNLLSEKLRESVAGFTLPGAAETDSDDESGDDPDLETTQAA